MEAHNATQDRTEYVNTRIQDTIDAHGDVAEFEPMAQIGKGDDAYLTTRIVFDNNATAQQVAKVKRSLPMSFDKELRAEGSKLTISVQVQTA